MEIKTKAGKLIVIAPDINVEDIGSKKRPLDDVIKDIRPNVTNKIEVDTAKGKLFVTATTDDTKKLIEKVILERPQKVVETHPQRPNLIAVSKVSDALKDKTKVALPSEEVKKTKVRFSILFILRVNN